MLRLVWARQGKCDRRKKQAYKMVTIIPHIARARANFIFTFIFSLQNFKFLPRFLFSLEARIRAIPKKNTKTYYYTSLFSASIFIFTSSSSYTRSFSRVLNSFDECWDSNISEVWQNMLTYRKTNQEHVRKICSMSRITQTPPSNDNGAARSEGRPRDDVDVGWLLEGRGAREGLCLGFW